MSEKYKLPDRYAVYEKIPQYNAFPDQIILGEYTTPDDAEIDRIKYGYDTENYYVAKVNK